MTYLLRLFRILGLPKLKMKLFRTDTSLLITRAFLLLLLRTHRCSCHLRLMMAL